MVNRTLLNFGRSGLAALALSALVVTTDVTAATAGGWRLEEGVSAPSYAVAEPVASNLNIDVVALVCEEAGSERGLQLQLYLSSPGPLIPAGASPQSLKDQARAEIVLDGQAFPIDILFADDRVVLADSRRQQAPVLSDRLVHAMEAARTMALAIVILMRCASRTMQLRFDLVNERPGAAPAFDGEATIDLRAGAGSQALAAVRRCAEPAGRPMASASTPSN